MTNIEIHHRCADFDSYRAATVKSLFNVESGANFDLTVDLPLHERDWQIGVIVLWQNQYWQKIRQAIRAKMGEKRADCRRYQPQWRG